MSSETRLAVKYHNDLSHVNFRKFNAVELDLLFTICALMKEQNENTLTFHFDKLRALVDYKKTTIDSFVKVLDTTYKKLINLNFRIGTDREFTRFVLFTEYTVSADEQTVKIKVHEKFKYLLNDVPFNFTNFELREFINLKSKYAKNLYRLLKQFRATGYMKISVDDFKDKLDVAKSYRMTDITRQVLNPAIAENKVFFKDLKVRKIKSRKGNKIEFFEFLFEPETIGVHQGQIVRAIGDGKFKRLNIWDLDDDDFAPELKDY